MSHERQGIYEFRAFRLDVGEHTLTRNDGVSDGALPEKAFQTLCVLVQNSGRLVSKDQLMEEVWPDSIVEENNLDKCIHSIRHALGETPELKYIETVRKHGYRFVEAVRVVDPTAPGSRPIAINLAESTAAIRYRPALAVVVLGLLIGAALVAYALYKNVSISGSPERAVRLKTSRITSIGKARNAALSNDGRFVAYSVEDGDTQLIRLQNIGSRSDLPILRLRDVNVRSLKFSTDGDSIFYVAENAIYKLPILGGNAVKVSENVSETFATTLTIAPDGGQLAFARGSGGLESSIVVANEDGANERLLVTNAELGAIAVGSPAWSPDGSVVAFLAVDKDGNHKPFIADIANKTFAPLSVSESISIHDLAWIHGGNALIALAVEPGTFQGEIWRVAYPQGRAEKLSNDSDDYFSVSASADGRRLSAIRGEHIAHIFKLSTAMTDAVQLTAGFDKFDGLNGIGWVSDEQIVYTSWPSGKPAISVMTADGTTVGDAIGGCSMFATSPKTKVLVSLCYKDNSWLGLWKTNLVDGTQSNIFTGFAYSPAMAPDGESVVFVETGDQTTVWRIGTSGGEPTKLLELPGFALAPAFSPDGRTVAIYRRSQPEDQTGEIVIFSSSTGKIQRTLPAELQANGGGGRETLQWTPDGSAITYVRLLENASNIWRQPVAGGTPTQVTTFTSARIFNFSYSPDSRTLLLSRGSLESDIILLEGFE